MRWTRRRLPNRRHLRPQLWVTGDRLGRPPICQRSRLASQRASTMPGSIGATYSVKAMTGQRTRAPSVTAQQAQAEMEAAGWRPDIPYPGRLRVGWLATHLPCETQRSPSLHAVRRRVACDACEGRRISAAEAERRAVSHGLQPLGVYPGRTDAPWLCLHRPCGREVNRSLDQISVGKVCPPCGRERGHAARRTTPEDARQELVARGFSPLADFPGLFKPWISRHLACGAVVSPRLSNLRSRDGVGCLNCRSESIRRSRAPDQEARREEAARFELQPLEPFLDVRAPWRCIHLPCGREVTPRLQHLRAGIGSCRPCAAEAAGARRRRPEDHAAALLAEAGWTPIAGYPGRPDAPWLASHRCGHQASVVPNVLARAAIGEGCIGCRSRRAGAARRSRLAEGAAAELRSHGYEPLGEYPGIASKWHALHEDCDTEVFIALGKLRAGSGCPSCSARRRRHLLPASVYVVSDGMAHKVGVASGSRRLREHESCGWIVYRTTPFAAGRDAYAVERTVLRRLRGDLGLFPYYRHGEMKQGGWSETVDAMEIGVHDLWLLVEEAAMTRERQEPERTSRRAPV